MKYGKKYRTGLRIRNRAIEKAKQDGLNCYRAHVIEDNGTVIAYAIDGEKIVYYNLK